MSPRTPAGSEGSTNKQKLKLQCLEIRKNIKKLFSFSSKIKKNLISDQYETLQSISVPRLFKS